MDRSGRARLARTACAEQPARAPAGLLPAHAAARHATLREEGGPQQTPPLLRPAQQSRRLFTCVWLGKKSLRFLALLTLCTIIKL